MDKLKAIFIAIFTYWSSKRSTLHGYVSVALGLVSGVYGDAFHTLGVGQATLAKISAMLVILGALLITPGVKE